MNDPAHITRPDALSEDMVVRLVSELYGLPVKMLQEFVSFIDRNYLVEDNPTSDSVSSRRRYVLKILNSVESKESHKIDAMNEVLLYAKQVKYPISSPLINLEGSYQRMMLFENKVLGCTELLSVRLFEYLPGTTLSNVALTKSLCHQIGHCAGWLNKICQSFPPNIESKVTSFKADWNLTNLSCVRSYLDVIEDVDRRSIIDDIISEFENQVLKHADMFSKGVIHNDLNDCNLIVTSSSTPTLDVDQGPEDTSDSRDRRQANEEPESYRITGVIDFTDACFSYLLFEVAVAICFIWLRKNEMPPFEASRCILSGYLRHIKLSWFELRRLRVCVCARFVLSSVMCLQAQRKYPENDYISFHANRMWESLEIIWPMSDEMFLQKLKIEGEKS